MDLKKTCSCGSKITTRTIKKLNNAEKFGFRKAFHYNCNACQSTGILTSKLYDRRLSYFESLNSHPWFSRLMPKLKKDGVEFCKKWIQDYGHMSPDQWMHHVNRMGLGMVEQPKFIDIANEILCVVGTGTDPRDKRSKMRG